MWKLFCILKILTNKIITMTRATIIDTLEDEYGIKVNDLNPRELAIIGLCTNHFVKDEKYFLNKKPLTEDLIKEIMVNNSSTWYKEHEQDQALIYVDDFIEELRKNFK